MVCLISFQVVKNAVSKLLLLLQGLVHHLLLLLQRTVHKLLLLRHECLLLLDEGLDSRVWRGLRLLNHSSLRYTDSTALAEKHLLRLTPQHQVQNAKFLVKKVHWLQEAVVS